MRQFVFLGKCKELWWWDGDALGLDSILPPTPSAVSENSLRKICSFPSQTWYHRLAYPPWLCVSTGVGKYWLPTACLCFLFLCCTFLKRHLMFLFLQDFASCIDAPVSKSSRSVPAKNQGKAHHSPISVFLLSKWVSGRGGRAPSLSVIGMRQSCRRRLSSLSHFAFLVEVGCSCSRSWWAWHG